MIHTLCSTWKPAISALALTLSVGVVAAGAADDRSGAATESAATFDALGQAFDEAVDQFMKEYTAAGEDEREAMLEDPEREPRQRFTRLFLEQVRRLRGTDAALPGWIWLAEHGAIADPGVGDEAVSRLLADHLDSPELGPAAKAISRSAGVRGRQRALDDLGVLVERSPHQSVQAVALLQRGLLRKRSEDPAELAAARADLERAARLATDEATSATAREELAELGVLAVGSEAPLLAGATVRGEGIDACDLRGRVVLVEFWGLWCGPCVAKIPELNRLQARFADRPFTIVGVNSDARPEAVRRFLETEGVPWPSIADGSTEGPVATAWHVRSWPAAYLIDREGRIVARDPSVDEIAAALSAP